MKDITAKLAATAHALLNACTTGDKGLGGQHMGVRMPEKMHVENLRAALTAYTASQSTRDEETVERVARALEGIGPRCGKLVCKGCPAYETKAWSEIVEDESDSGQYAWCNAADRRSMGSYHYDHDPAPEWCPARAALSSLLAPAYIVEVGDLGELLKITPVSARDDALDALRELSERATGGEWAPADWGYDGGDDKTTVETSRPEVLSPGQSNIWPDGIRKVRIASTEEGDNPLADAAFIAAAVNYVRAKLAAAQEPR